MICKRGKGLRLRKEGGLQRWIPLVRTSSLRVNAMKVQGLDRAAGFLLHQTLSCGCVISHSPLRPSQCVFRTLSSMLPTANLVHNFLLRNAASPNRSALKSKLLLQEIVIRPPRNGCQNYGDGTGARRPGQGTFQHIWATIVVRVSEHLVTTPQSPMLP